MHAHRSYGSDVGTIGFPSRSKLFFFFLLTRNWYARQLYLCARVIVCVCVRFVRVCQYVGGFYVCILFVCMRQSLLVARYMCMCVCVCACWMRVFVLYSNGTVVIWRFAVFIVCVDPFMPSACLCVRPSPHMNESDSKLVCLCFVVCVCLCFECIPW